MIENVYQHFRKEERSFYFDKLPIGLENVEDQYTPYLTNFLDSSRLIY